MSKDKKKKQLPDNETERNKQLMGAMRYRLVFLGIIITISMIFIIMRLFQVQIYQQNEYRDKLSRFNVTEINELPMRGDIIDRNGSVLSTNQEMLDIIYIAPLGETVSMKWNKAKAFVDLFEVDTESMTLRDRKDAFIHYFDELANDLITPTEKQQLRTGELRDSDIYNLKLDRINDGHLIRLSQRQLQEFMIFQRMHIVPGLIKDIKQDISIEETAILIENTNILSGFLIHPSYSRIIFDDHNLGSLIGSMTTNKQGLLAETANYNQALNYNLTDQIGASGLEAYYESVLSGKKLKYQVLYNNQGIPRLELVDSGENGATLQLTIDKEFQKRVEEITEIRLKEAIQNRNTAKIYGDRMLLVVSDVTNGEVLALAGVYRSESGNFNVYNSGTYLEAYSPGSSIKGAMVYMGLEKNLFRPGERILDQPVKIAGTVAKRSSAVLGMVDDIRAMAVSSNVYMYNVVFRLGRANYRYDQPLNLDPNTLSEMRKNFSQFGLGSATGLDVPLESNGYKGIKPAAGNLLDFATGQYDTYSVMQLNQYALTLANGGHRYQLHFAKHAIEPKSENVVFQYQPTILNSLADSNALRRVQMGMRACVTSGYCSPLRNAIVPAAAKTGTAEDFVFDNGKLVNTATSTLVAYAPYDNPKIAISCITPNETRRRGTYSGCMYATEDIINLYFSENQHN